MASNEIVFKVKVEKDGNLSVVAKEAEKAAKGTDKVTKSTDKLNKSRSSYSKTEKGVGQAGLSGAKSFSKMRQEIGGGSSGLVGAYAVLAANIFALTAAFGALQRAAQVAQLEQGLASLGTASGIALKSLSANLREVTGNALSMEDAMRSVALASSAGFDSSSIERLGDVARKASIALGRDTADSLNRLTKGAIKLEPELLDELGIMVRLDTATTNYARSVNKSVNDLTTFEKRQGFMNAVLEEGERKFAAMGNVKTNSYDQLSATFADLTKNLLNFLNNGLLPIVNFFAGSQVALFGAMTLFAKGIATQMIPGLANLGAKYVEARHAAAQYSLEQLKGLKTMSGGGVRLGKLASAFDPAIHGQAELNEMMDAAKASVKANSDRLTSMIKKEKELGVSSLEAAAAIEKKKATLEASEQALRDVSDYQTKFTASLSDETKASAVSSAASGKYADAMEFLSQAKREMGEETQRTNSGLDINAQRINNVGLAARRGALSVRVFGTAFLNAIPLIGQIIFAIGVFLSVADKVIEFFKSDEQKEYEKMLKKQAEANLELVESMKAVAAYEGGRSSIIDNVTQSYTAQFNILTGLNKQMEDLNKTGKTGGMQSIFSAVNQGGYKDMFKSMVEGGMLTAEMLPELTKGLSKAEARFVTAAVEGGYFDGVMDKTAKTLLTKLLPGMVEWPTIMHNLTQSTKEANQAVDEFSNSLAFKTNVDAVLASFANMSKSMKKLGTGTAEEWVAGFKENAGSNMSNLIDLDGITAKAFESYKLPTDSEAYYKSVQKQIKERTAALEGIFKTEQSLQRLAKSKIASNKAINKLLGTQLLMSGNAKEIEENKIKIAQQELELLESQQRLFEESTLLNKQDAEYKERVLAYDNQIAEANERTKDLGQAALGTAKENLRIAEHAQQVGRTVNEDIQKRIDLLKKETSARETIATNEARAANRDNPANRGKGATSAAQDFKRNFQDLDKNGETLEHRKLSAIAIEANAKHAMVDMEMTMLKFRLQVLMKEMAHQDKVNGIKTDTSSVQSIIDNIDGEGGLRQTALALITEERKAAESVITEARAVGIEAVQEQLRTGGDKIGQGSSGEASAVLAVGNGTSSTEESRANSQTGESDPVDVSFLDRVDMMKSNVQGLMDIAAKLGPDGEVVSAVTLGAVAISESWGGVADAIKGGAVGMEKGAAIAGAVASTISAVGNMMAKSSAAKVAGIDKEIAAEQKRDGKSKESIAKIKALEAKKEATKKKAFDQNKKMMMAQTIATTAAAVMQSFVNAGGFPLGMPMAIAMGAIGAANLAIIAGTSYEGGGSAGAGLGGPSSISIGKRDTSSDLSKSQSARGELAYFRGGEGTGGAENFRSAFYGSKHRASGGNTGYVVGEQGPELFMPDRPGTIVPADDFAAGGAGANVTFSINAIDAAGVEDVLVQQQGNIIGMLREAANSYGENFMEDLDESTYTTPVARRA